MYNYLLHTIVFKFYLDLWQNQCHNYFHSQSHIINHCSFIHLPINFTFERPTIRLDSQERQVGQIKSAVL
jgi:hypothetical protein